MVKSNNRSYELIFITKEDKEDIFKTIDRLVSLSGGEVANKEGWGKKSFAYPIKKLSGGYYFAWGLALPQNNLKTFEKSLRFDEDILRYLLLTNN